MIEAAADESPDSRLVWTIVSRYNPLLHVCKSVLSLTNETSTTLHGTSKDTLLQSLVPGLVAREYQLSPLDCSR